MSSRCQLQAKILVALAVMGVAVGAIVLFTVDEAFWAVDNLEADIGYAERDQAADHEAIKAWAGLITFLGSSYLLCIAGCFCCADRAVKFLALLSPLVFFLSAVAYVVAFLLGCSALSAPSAPETAEIPGPGFAILSFVGLLIGSLACCVAGCCVSYGNSQPVSGPGEEKNAGLPKRLVAVTIAATTYVIVAAHLARDHVFQSPFCMIMGFVAGPLGCFHCFLVFFAHREHFSETVNDNSQNEEERAKGRRSDVVEML
eukprot:Skav200267  [mRNA]  locus=scaffold93:21214:21987:- [translate_table: standard]